MAMLDNTAIVNATQNLPVPFMSEIEGLGYRLLRALDRMGYVHERRDGAVFAIRFDAVRVYGASWAAYHIDAERLYHFSVSDLSKPSVLAQLSAVTRKPVRSFTEGGLAFVIELQPKSKAKLPDKVTLDLTQRPSGDLLVPLGMGRDGAAWVTLPKLGHCLIVGTTGAGKSTWLHSGLASLLTSAGPDRLRLVLLDPKRHELTAWAQVPHLMGEIAYTEEQAAARLADLVAEVDRRGDLLAGALVRDLAAYNKKSAEQLPYVLAVIDECLDLVLSAGNKSDLAGYLKTLAIRGRSVGVILWAATQHAAAITGMPRVVNTNLTARLVFRVADRSAAEVAGCIGAELLPRDRPGRFLCKIDGAPVELQGFYLDDDNLLAVARGVGGNVASGPTLTDTERALLTWAANENSGVLTLANIRAVAGVGQREARRVAAKLELRGLLQKDTSDDNRRVVTEMGRVSAGISDKPTNLTNLTNRNGDLTNRAANRQTALGAEDDEAAD